MPEISRFLGIVITMCYGDHNPPHFHAQYGKYKISVEIKTKIVSGRFPPRALKSVLEWAENYDNELLQDWELAKDHKQLNHIEPLE